ncbi:RDD family protein [Abyssibacter profundi]|uniref:RDD domain-containing protein n=1 Tax=Abyssibacter profundi TaxID=2182787 RepID=A0A363UNX6_9GAMM|nr:RDD family protein [Abyssibacter profundi]PWN57134.1 hypothetical protein DEH80_04185 [Abyssibacter profundi]
MASVTSPASLWIRLAAIVYDSLLVAGIWILGTFALMPFTGGAVDAPWYRIYLFTLTALFFVGFWCRAGQTLGMQAWRLRVRSRDGQRLMLTQGVVRLTVAWLTLGASLLWCLFDPERRGLHDLVANTEVVREPRS